jgi:hypothetical protein
VRTIVAAPTTPQNVNKNIAAIFCKKKRHTISILSIKNFSLKNPTSKNDRTDRANEM